MIKIKYILAIGFLLHLSPRLFSQDLGSEPLEQSVEEEKSKEKKTMQQVLSEIDGNLATTLT